MKYILIIILIFLFPIPLITSINFSHENYYIKLYNFKILSKQSSKKHKRKPKKKPNSTKNLPYLKLIYSIDNLKIKPLIYIKGSLDYSLNNAARDAIMYGIIYSFVPFAHRIIKILFHIFKKKISIKPLYVDKFIINIRLRCIVFISIGQIIYMICVLLNTFIIYEEEKYDN